MMLSRARDAAKEGRGRASPAALPLRNVQRSRPRHQRARSGMADHAARRSGRDLLRWKDELRPHGFTLQARVVDFPDGIPGDIGLFLSWSKW